MNIEAKSASASSEAVEHGPRSNRDSIRAVERGLFVLQAINRGGSVSMAQIARSTAMAYPTACRMVQTMIDCGMVEREPGGKKYRVTPLVETLSHGFRKEDKLAKVARPHMEKLTQEIVWPLYLSCRIGDTMMVRESTDSMTTLTFDHYNPGFRMPLLDSSSGKVQLAFSERDETELALKGVQLGHGSGENYVRGLKEALGKTRKDGFATVAHHWYMEPKGKTSALSVPVMQDGRAVGALSVLFFSSAMSIDEAIAKYFVKLNETAQNISRDFATLTSN
jgi:IclR family mhp operon transcriptional activator